MKTLRTIGVILITISFLVMIASTLQSCGERTRYREQTRHQEVVDGHQIKVEWERSNRFDGLVVYKTKIDSYEYTILKVYMDDVEVLDKRKIR